MVRFFLRARDGRTARLSLRGKATLGVGVVSIVVAYAAALPELLYLGVLAVLLPVIAALLARFRRLSLEVGRVFTPGIVAVGQPATVELTVRNLGIIRTPQLVWRDERPWASRGNPVGTLPPLAARRGRGHAGVASTTVRYELTAPRRGVFDVGPLEVVLADPFGFASAELSVGATDRLVVTPHLAEMPDTGLALLANEGASMLVRRAVGGDDDLSTREYRTGDALRRVHWRATARLGELMVRQEEPRSHAEARVILDTRLTGYPEEFLRNSDDPESAAFELAISLAASVALHLARGGFEVELVETGPGQLDPVAAVESFLETLAEIELSGVRGGYPSEPDFDPFFRAEPGSGTVFAIISEPDAATLERLVAEPVAFDLAVAFVIADRDSPTLDRLRDAGWTCVSMALDDTVEGVWRAVSEIRGARHGR